MNSCYVIELERLHYGCSLKKHDFIFSFNKKRLLQYSIYIEINALVYLIALCWDESSRHISHDFD